SYSATPDWSMTLVFVHHPRLPAGGCHDPRTDPGTATRLRRLPAAVLPLLCLPPDLPPARSLLPWPALRLAPQVGRAHRPRRRHGRPHPAGVPQRSRLAPPLGPRYLARACRLDPPPSRRR